MMYLFVGGIRDGEWFNVPDDRQQWVVRERLPPISWVLPNPTELSYPRQMCYQKYCFRGSKHTYELFAAPGITPDDVICRLMGGYRHTEGDDA